MLHAHSIQAGPPELENEAMPPPVGPHVHSSATSVLARAETLQSQAYGLPPNTQQAQCQQLHDQDGH